MELAKISYSVPLKNVPYSVSKIVKQAHEQLIKSSDVLSLQHDNLIAEEPELIKILQKIDSVRVELMAVDSLLIDVTAILSGYQQMLVKPFLEEGNKNNEKMEVGDVIETD